MSEATTIPWWEAVARANKPHMELPDYLHRWVLAQNDVREGHYLHRLLGPDVRAFHDHPWPFETTILNGGYTVLIVPNPRGNDPLTRVYERTFFAGDRHFMETTEAHRIVSVEPDTWTLVQTGMARRDWGFYREVAGGLTFVDRDTFLASRWNTQAPAVFHHSYKVEAA